MWKIIIIDHSWIDIWLPSILLFIITCDILKSSNAPLVEKGNFLKRRGRGKEGVKLKELALSLISPNMYVCVCECAFVCHKVSPLNTLTYKHTHKHTLTGWMWILVCICGVSIYLLYMYVYWYKVAPCTAKSLHHLMKTICIIIRGLLAGSVNGW